MLVGGDKQQAVYRTVSNVLQEPLLQTQFTFKHLILDGCETYMDASLLSSPTLCEASSDFKVYTMDCPFLYIPGTTCQDGTTCQEETKDEMQQNVHLAALAGP